MTYAKQQVRIIGGYWRGRKLKFPNCSQVRPTSDRVRETLFNWLMPYLSEALCLDLFAGSGVLGFEALSRGARHVTMVDQSKQVVDCLKYNAKLLDIAVIDESLFATKVTESNLTQPVAVESERTHTAEFGSLSICHKCFNPHSELTHLPYNIIFLDPPFDTDLLAASLQWLQQQNILARNALVYMEHAKNYKVVLPHSWNILKSKQAGQVHYSLVQHA